MAFTKGRSGNPAGRPRRAEKFARPIALAEKRIADKLPGIIDNLFALADGGYERVEDRYEPAGTVLIDVVLQDADGKPLVDAKGTPVRGKQQAFPDLPADQLVLVQRTVSIADRDRTANQYLADRVLGKPTERQEIAGDSAAPLRIVLG